MKNNEGAIKHFEMVASDNTSAMRDSALFNLTRIYKKNGDTEKSLEYCNKLFDEHPDSISNKFAEEKLSSG